jgi:hypothetical protein
MLLVLFFSLFQFEQPEIWQHLQENSFYFKEGDTETLRSSFVGFQGEMEENLVNLLEKGDITDLHVIIHTLTPPTPLCTTIDAIGVHPTVARRAVSIRKLLDAGAYLTGAFPEAGMMKMKQEEIALYNLEKVKYPRYQEIFLPEFNEKDSGATYFIRTKEGEEWIFAITFFQINTEQKICQAALLLGIKEDSHCKNHLEQINGIKLLSK